MKTLFRTLLVVAMALVLSGANEDSSKAYRIVGQYIDIEPDTTESIDPATSGQTDTADLSNATILITYELENEDGESETVELASGSFVDGKIAFEGEIDEPLDIKISVPELEKQRVFTHTTLTPGGEEISFALVDEPENDMLDRIAFLGTSRKVKNPVHKFLITGDLASMSKDLSQAHVLINSLRDVTGNPAFISSGNMLPSGNKFRFEGEAQEPAIVRVSVMTLHDPEYFASSVYAVVEPGAEISIHAQGEEDRLVATSGSGRHANLIESWRQSTEYLDLRARLDVAKEEFVSGQAPLWEAVESGGGEEAIAKFNEYIKDDDHEYLKIERRLEEIRSDTLQSIAKNAEDPLDSLLAMELEAFRLNAENRSEAFQVYDKLADVLDEDLVIRRVVPAREKLTQFIAGEKNDADLVAGQKVPDFMLTDLNGEEVALYDVLEDNELVLVEFWASWCGPCIKAFPDLKTLHADYNDRGFEIVSISIDNDTYSWEQESKAQELPWIDVGEMDGWNGPTATAFGVQFVPKGYLVDREGVILEKDLGPDELGEFLTGKFGDKN